MKKYLNYVNGLGYQEKVVGWVNINLRNYLKNNPENQGEIEHILDYLNDTKAPKQIRAPKRIKYMSYEEANEKAKKWVKWLNKKAANIIETEEDVEVIKTWKSGMSLVKLKGEAAFKREGKLMSHCVASYYDKEGTDVYSLRDSNNVPHCTLEVLDEGLINQIKGKGNGSIHPKYIKYIIKSLKKLGKEVRDSELENLGYKIMNKNFKSFLYKNFEKDSIKTLTYNNKLYFYKYSKLKEI